MEEDGKKRSDKRRVTRLVQKGLRFLLGGVKTITTENRDGWIPENREFINREIPSGATTRMKIT